MTIHGPRLAAGLVIVSGALVGAALAYLRSEAIDSAERRTDSLSQVIGEQATRTVQTIDIRLGVAVQQLEKLRAAKALDETTARAALRLQLQDLPFVRAFWVVDRNGVIVYDSDVGNIGLSLADRPYFQWHAQHPDAAVHIGPPVRSRSTGDWLVSVSRPMPPDAGGFNGIIVAAFEPRLFQKTWQSIDLGPGGAVGLLNREGRMLMRSPPDDAVMDRDFSRFPLFSEQLAARTQGVFLSRSPVDGGVRLTAFRVLPAYPELLVAVGSSYEGVLAPWRRFAALTAIIWAVSVAAAIALYARLLRQMACRRREIDQLRRAQDQLRSQSNMLSIAGRLALLGGWVFDVASGRIRWTDEAAATVDMPCGSTPTREEVFEMLTPASRETAARVLGACIEHGEPFDVEVEMVTPKGRCVCLRSIGRPVRDAGGAVVRIEGAQQDITQRVRLVAEIRELNAGLEERIAQRTRELASQEALFRALAEQVPMPVWTTDVRGNLTFASRAWYELFGGEPPQWNDQRWFGLVHPDDRDMIARNWADAKQGKRPYAGTRRLRAASGEYRTTSYEATPVKSEGGETLFWVGVDVDITDMMANQVALKRATEQMRAFSYSVSHDLRSPLQRIAAFAKLLEAEIGGQPAGKAMHYLARIQANAHEMSQLIEGLLSMAHVAELEMARGPVNVSSLAVEILERLETAEPHRAVRWSVTPGLVVTGDVRLMRSAMENLLGNAWKFTSRTADAVIEVGGSQERSEYWVRDNGAGFDMAHAGRLFETFHRLHRADEFPGTGIGLATVARAINRQGGSIWAQSEPGKGATFYFTMPGPTQG